MVRLSENHQTLVSQMESKDKEIQELRDKMVKVEKSQLKSTELLEVMNIAKSRDGKIGKDRTRVEMKVPLDGFEASSYQSASKRLV